MSDVQDYNSSLSDAAASRKFETFSYLPSMDADRIRPQIDYTLMPSWLSAKLVKKHTQATTYVC